MYNNAVNRSRSSQRMPALDLARIFAMLMMIQGHTLFEMAIPSQIDTNVFPWNVWLFMRGLTAPIFLMVSGVVQVFANKRDLSGNLEKKTIWRRIRIAIGIIFLGYMFLFPADKIYHLLFIRFSFWQPFLQVNTLQLIGVSLLMVLLVFNVTKSDRSLGIASLIISGVILLFTPFVHIIHWFKILPEFAAAYLSLEHGSIFTIFPFTAFMFFGVAIGTVLKNIPHESRYQSIMKYGVPIGLGFIAAGWVIYALVGMAPYQFIDPLKGNPGMSVIRMGCVFIILAGITWIYTKTEKFAPIYSLFGKRALFVYVSHLLILYGTPWMPSIAKLYHYSLPVGYSFLIAFIVAMSSLLLAYYYETSLHRYPSAKAYFRYAMATLLIFVLFV